jgi:hypothetical protein
VWWCVSLSEQILQLYLDEMRQKKKNRFMPIAIAQGRNLTQMSRSLKKTSPQVPSPLPRHRWTVATMAALLAQLKEYIYFHRHFV